MRTTTWPASAVETPALAVEIDEVERAARAVAAGQGRTTCAARGGHGSGDVAAARSARRDRAAARQADGCGTAIALMPSILGDPAVRCARRQAPTPLPRTTRPCPNSKTPRFIQTWHRRRARPSGAPRAPRSPPSRRASRPKFFYDRLGSHLFEAITELPEYYPTRTEAAIFAAPRRRRWRDAVGSGMTLIDLGAGNCAKAASLFPLLEPKRYVAVDISVEFLRDACAELQREHPQLDDRRPRPGLLAAALELPAELLGGERPVFFYPGSSIGNFTPDEALAFLRRVRDQADGGGLLIGVDLVKPRAVLEAAYDDALGVTAAFNLNVLRHLNRLIGSDFEPRQWRHVALLRRRRSRASRCTSRRARRWP